MKTYRNASNQDGEILYEIGERSITLIFKKSRYDKGVLYHYSKDSMLRENIVKMCHLAQSGKGLRTFIHSRNTSHLVQHDYIKHLN